LVVGYSRFDCPLPFYKVFSMFGTYQHSNLRIEVNASADKVSKSLTEPDSLKKWLQPQDIRFSDGDRTAKSLSASGSTPKLFIGQTFESRLGPIKLNHQVEALSAFGVRFLLSGSIDGFHEWQWGDGWVQSRLEGVSLLPLNLTQTLSLSRLRAHLQE
jgi:hypothetical protein